MFKRDLTTISLSYDAGRVTADQAQADAQRRFPERIALNVLAPKGSQFIVVNLNIRSSNVGA
jgi:hypothetical protein